MSSPISRFNIFHIFDDGVQVEHARVHHLLTAKGEELARQGRRSMSRLQHFVHASAQAAVSGRALLDNSPYPIITPNRLLKSWATPPESLPTASIF